VGVITAVQCPVVKVHKNAVDGAMEKTEDLTDFFSGK
jgi:hypothetical protein